MNGEYQRISDPSVGRGLGQSNIAREASPQGLTVSELSRMISEMVDARDALHKEIAVLQERLHVVCFPDTPPPVSPEGVNKNPAVLSPLGEELTTHVVRLRSMAGMVSRITSRLAI